MSCTQLSDIRSHGKPRENKERLRTMLIEIPARTESAAVAAAAAAVEGKTIQSVNRRRLLFMCGMLSITSCANNFRSVGIRANRHR